jgi:hypothetical protein
MLRKYLSVSHPIHFRTTLFYKIRSVWMSAKESFEKTIDNVFMLWERIWMRCFVSQKQNQWIVFLFTELLSIFQTEQHNSGNSAFFERWKLLIQRDNPTEMIWSAEASKGIAWSWYKIFRDASKGFYESPTSISNFWIPPSIETQKTLKIAING